MSLTASQSTNLPKLCFVAHFAYGAMARDGSGHIGGVEHQVTMMARWFVSQGYSVSLITWDEGYDNNTVIEGVRLIKLCARSAGLPGLRFFTPRWTSLVRALAQADADIYYHNCAEYVTGQVAHWCQRHGKRFVYSVASDPDCDPALPTLTSWRERKLYRYGLQHADKVIVQTGSQQQALKSGFNVDADVIGMPCTGISGDEFEKTVQLRRDKPFRVIWVGRMDPVKRPEFYLRVAEKLPEIQFDLIGGYDQDAEYAQSILSQAKILTNVAVHGRVNREHIGKFYADGAALCCTSTIEGFPNTFLEAWSYGLPIISTVDPDNLLSTKSLGVFVNDEQSTVKAIEQLANDDELRLSYTHRCRDYYLQHHQLDKVMGQFAKAFVGEV